MDFTQLSTEELRLILHEKKQTKDWYDSKQYSLKIFMNSVYGAFASGYFSCFNEHAAASITLQGQSLTKFAERVLNQFFKTEINDVKFQNSLGFERNFTNNLDVAFYSDTDSVFISLENIFNLGFYEHPDYKIVRKIILDIYEKKLKNYINTMMEKYAAKYGVTNLQYFELEKIATAGIFLKKKKYVYDPIWKMPNIDLEPLKKIQITGVEIIRSETPIFMAENLSKLLIYIFQHNKNIDMSDLIKKLKQMKEEYRYDSLDRVCCHSTANNYNEYVLNDREFLTLGKKCPVHIRGAGFYNYLLNQSPKFKKKYELIKSNEKISWYYTKDTRCNSVAFPKGTTPTEILPEVDYDYMFNKKLLVPLNRFISIIMKQEIPENLTLIKRLF